MTAELPAQPVERMCALHDNDPIAAQLGIELVAAEPDRVVVQMTVDDRHTGGHGLCHGGMLFTLADVAMSLVCNRHQAKALATNATIDFVSGVLPGATVVATAVERNLRGRAGISEATLTVDGAIVALFSGRTLQVR